MTSDAESAAVRLDEPQVRSVRDLAQVMNLASRRDAPMLEAVFAEYMPCYEPCPEAPPIGVVTAL